MAEAQGKLSGRPGICFVTRGPGRHQREHRPAHRVPGLDADDPVRRPGRRAISATARPSRRSTTGRCSAPARWGMAKWVAEVHDGRPPARIRRARLPHRDAGPARAGGAGAARGHADARRPPRRCCRASSRRRPGRRRARCATLRAMLLAAQAAVRHRRRQRLDGRVVPRRCSASPRTGSCRSAAPSASRTLFDNRHPLYAGDVGIGINPKLAAAHARGRPDRSRSARGWAR